MFSITDIREFRRESRQKADEHARRNARFAAELLEEDRTATRKDELAAELEELYRERERINVRIFDLECELVKLKGGRCA